jgi:transcriptional regulator with XRE-family HTH domain
MKATPTDARPYLARTVSRLRRQSGLTHNELALLADLDRQAVSKVEEGLSADLSWKTVQKLAVVLGVATDVFRNPNLAAAPDGRRVVRRRQAPAPWLRFRYVLRYRDGEGVEREEPFEGGGAGARRWLRAMNCSARGQGAFGWCASAAAGTIRGRTSNRYRCPRVSSTHPSALLDAPDERMAGATA